MCYFLIPSRVYPSLNFSSLILYIFLGCEVSSGRTSISARGLEMLLSCPNRRMWNRPRKSPARVFLCWRVLRLLSNSWPSTRSTFSIAERLSKKWWSESRRKTQRVMRALPILERYFFRYLDHLGTYASRYKLVFPKTYYLDTYTYSPNNFVVWLSKNASKAPMFQHAMG